MKKRIDYLTARDDSIQSFLFWVSKKTEAIKGRYKAPSVRALYFNFECKNSSINLDQRNSRSIDLSSAIDPDILPARIFDLEIARDIDFYELIELFLKGQDKVGSVSMIVNILGRIIEKTGDSDPELTQEIREIKRLLPSADDLNNLFYSEDLAQLYIAIENRLQLGLLVWAKKVQVIMSRYRDIGRNWQFSEAQQEKIQKYYNANKFLVECLNSDCYVTKATRQYIEDTLLLPLSEIEKYPVPDAIANL